MRAAREDKNNRINVSNFRFYNPVHHDACTQPTCSHGSVRRCSVLTKSVSSAGAESASYQYLPSGAMAGPGFKSRRPTKVCKDLQPTIDHSPPKL